MTLEAPWVNPFCKSLMSDIENASTNKQNQNQMTTAAKAISTR